MTLCGLRPYLNMSESWTLHQVLNVTHNMAEDFPFLNVENLETHILCGFTILISMFGLVGNGIVFWFLCFCLKRASFIFIANLAVADFGVLFSVFIHFSLFFIVWLYGHSHNVICVMNLCLAFLYLVMICASALFLTAIGAERCVAVFFPHWHRCHRPKSLPTIVSALLWPLASMIGGLMFYNAIWLGDYIIGITPFFLFDSFILLSILTLLIRVYCYSNLCRKGRLLKVILLALSVFIITLIPQYFLHIFFQDINRAYLINYFLTCLNSSANPFIYFFVGRLRSGVSWRSLKVLLKKVFNEEEDFEGQPSCTKSSVQTTKNYTFHY